MTVSTLIKRLAEFIETESGACDVIVFNDGDDRPRDVKTAGRQNEQGQIYFEICI